MGYLTPYLSGEVLTETAIEAEGLAGFSISEFDTIAVRGNSGLLLGAVLAARWNKDLIIVRKEERSHSGNLVEGWGKDQRILIVDDFIETGTTIDLVYEAVYEKCDNPSIYAVLLYASCEWAERNSNGNTYSHPDGTAFEVFRINRIEGGQSSRWRASP